MRRISRVLSLIAAIAAASPALAQEPVREEQVALDESGSLLRIDAELARRLDLFAEYPGLRGVLLFRSPSGFTLEITTRRGDRLIRVRQPLSLAQVEALRADVSQRLAASAPSELLDRSGRMLLLASSTAAGLAFYGWAVPSILDVEEFRWQLGLYMVVSSASFFGPLIATRDRTVTMGMAGAAFWGGTRGIIHGIALHRIIAGPERPSTSECLPGAPPGCVDRIFYEEEEWQRWRLATAMGMSLAEGIGGLAWARAKNATPGEVHTLGVMGDFGGLWALGLATVAGLHDNDTGFWAAGLGGVAGGLATGAWLNARRDFSWGDAEVLRASGALGGYIGGVIADWTGADDDSETFAGLAVAASMGATVAGDRLLSDRTFSPGEGLLVDLATVAGGLLGAGVAVLINEGEDPTLPLTLGGVGALAGFAGTVSALGSPRGGGEPEGPGGGGAGGGRLEDLRLNLYPVLDANRGGTGMLPPLGFRLDYRF